MGKPVYKEKIRLRSYGTVQVQDNVFLEIKKKYKGLVNKRRTPILLSEAYDLFSKGKNPSSKEINPQVFSEISYLLSRYKVFPKVFISYDRFAFFENKNDDFRLTFDSKILTRRSDLQLESEIYGTPLLDDGMLLMEAKAEKTFPLWFAHFLAENKIYPVSFSKYGTEFIRNVQQNKI